MEDTNLDEIMLNLSKQAGDLIPELQQILVDYLKTNHKAPIVMRGKFDDIIPYK